MLLGTFPTSSPRGIGREKAHITHAVSKGTLKVQVLSPLQEDDTQGSCFSWPPATSVCLWVWLSVGWGNGRRSSDPWGIGLLEEGREEAMALSRSPFWPEA